MTLEEAIAWCEDGHTIDFDHDHTGKLQVTILLGWSRPDDVLGVGENVIEAVQKAQQRFEAFGYGRDKEAK